MKKIILCFALISVASFLFAEDSVIKRVTVDSFNSIEVSSAFEITVIKSNTRSVEIEISESVEEYLVARENGDTFELYLENVPNRKMTSDVILRAVIKTPELEGVDLSGAVDAVFKGDFKSADFELDLSGATKMEGLSVEALTGDIECSGASRMSESSFKIGKLDLDCSGASKLSFSADIEELNADISGATALSVKGEGEHIEISLSGASKVNFSEFVSDVVYLECSGASNISVNPLKNLNVEASGASVVKYKKSAGLIIGDIDVSGAASIKSY